MTAVATSSSPDYAVVLRPLPSKVPATARLRRFLKAALRAYGLRAVSVVEVPASFPGAKEETAGERD